MPYQLEYKRTVDSTWTVFSSTLTAGQFPATITGLVAGTQYDVRCLARDVSGNVSAYSATSQATTAGTIVWQTVPTITFTQGTASNIGIAQYDSKGATDTITHTAGTLPAGVTYDQTNKRYLYDGVGAVGGTNGHILTADDAADADWAAVLSSPGLLSSYRFASQADVTAVAFDPTLPFTLSHVVFDSTFKPGAASGSMRFNVLNADGFGNGSSVFWIDPTNHHIYNNGGEFFIRWRQYMPTAFAQTAFPGSGGIDSGKANGFKQILLSQFYNASGSIGNGGSNVPGEIVVENTRQVSVPQIYCQDSGGSDQQILTIYNGSDFRFTNQINNASPADPSGTLVYPQTAQKYGLMYANYPKQTGTPDPNNGGFVYRPNEWQTFMLHVRVGTIGNSNTLIEFWAAGEGLAPRLIHKTTTANPGNGNAGNGNIYTGYTLLPYCTARTNNGGFDTFTCYSDIATGTQKLPFPGGFSVTPS